MALLTGLILLFGAVIGFVVAWHWQRAKYEKVLKVLGSQMHASSNSTPS